VCVGPGESRTASTINVLKQINNMQDARFYENMELSDLCLSIDVKTRARNAGI
jgi:hypothetical protein